MKLRTIALVGALLVSAVASAEWPLFLPIKGGFTPTRVRVDSTGHTFLNGAKGNTEVVVTRFDQEGVLEWRKTYISNIGSVAVSDAAVDSQNNLVFACVEWNNTVGESWSTVKYDSTGKRAWVKREKKEFTKLFTGPNKIAIDENDNVYVSGSMYANAHVNVLVVKYGAGGDKRWEALEPGFGTTQLAVSRSGNINFSFSSADQLHLYVRQYWKSGKLRWAHALDSAPNVKLSPRAMQVDRSGAVVLGLDEVVSSFNIDYGILKLDGKDGTQIWHQAFGSHDTSGGVRSVVCGPDNAVYLAGFAFDLGVIVVKYSATGDLVWNRLITNVTSFAAMVLGANQTLYVPMVRGGTSVVTRQLSLDGETLDNITTPFSHYQDYVFDLSMNPQRTVAVASFAKLDKASGPFQTFLIRQDTGQ